MCVCVYVCIYVCVCVASRTLSKCMYVCVVTQSYITPDYFEGPLQSYLGNAFGVEPRLEHSAFFRPHNRSEDIENLYLVGASAQPGAGTPSVMMSAKITARVIFKDHGVPGVVGAAPVADAGQGISAK